MQMHAVKGNRFVFEGGHFDFDKISSVFKTYEIGDLKDNFILIGLVQNNKTAEDFFRDLRKYDTKDEWTYDFNDDDLMELCGFLVSHNHEMYDYFVKYGFAIYDMSTESRPIIRQVIH